MTEINKKFFTEDDLDRIDSHIDKKVVAIMNGSRNKMCYVKIDDLIELVRLARKGYQNEMERTSQDRN